MSLRVFIHFLISCLNVWSSEKIKQPSWDATECYPNGYVISVNRTMLAISIKSPEWFLQMVSQPIVWMHWMKAFLTLYGLAISRNHFLRGFNCFFLRIMPDSVIIGISIAINVILPAEILNRMEIGKSCFLGSMNIS